MTDNEPKTQNLSPSKSSRKAEIPDTIRNEIVRLHEYYGSREIARRVGWSRKIVRRVLHEQGCYQPPKPRSVSKLDPFRNMIQDKVEKGLTISRILRELREEGYSGGRSILADYVRTLPARQAQAPAKTVKRRFETRPGEEMQID